MVASYTTNNQDYAEAITVMEDTGSQKELASFIRNIKKEGNSVLSFYVGGGGRMLNGYPLFSKHTQ